MEFLKFLAYFFLSMGFLTALAVVLNVTCEIANEPKNRPLLKTWSYWLIMLGAVIVITIGGWLWLAAESERLEEGAV